MAERSFDEAQLEAAIARLEDSGRLQRAEQRMSAAAPALQRVLAAAMAAGGWFGDSHRSELRRVSAIADEAERASAVDLLIAEEARIAMMVGAAVGWALAEELSPEAESEPWADGDVEPGTENKER